MEDQALGIALLERACAADEKHIGEDEPLERRARVGARVRVAWRGTRVTAWCRARQGQGTLSRSGGGASRVGGMWACGGWAIATARVDALTLYLRRSRHSSDQPLPPFMSTFASSSRARGAASRSLSEWPPRTSPKRTWGHAASPRKWVDATEVSSGSSPAAALKDSKQFSFDSGGGTADMLHA